MISVTVLQQYWWIAALLVSLVTFGWPAARLLDRLLQDQYNHHRQQWEADGRLRGVFWRPRDVESCGSEDFILYPWFLFTPAWIADDPVRLRRLRALRLLVAAEISVCAVIVVTTII